MEEYSKYKPSGIEWIGDIPKNWNFVSCRLIVSERNEGMKKHNYLSLMANIGVIPYEEKGDIGNKKPENLEKCKIVYEGDLIINSMNYYIGSYGISKYDGICSPVYIVLYANTKVIEPRFAFRVFENPKFQGVAQSFGNGILEHRRAINWDILKNIKIPVPSLEEQRNILSFLDKKTEKIDALISDKEKLIKLLREYWQSIISETATKGLDKKVQMKPSGIEWIGDIPYDWNIIQIKRVFKNTKTLVGNNVDKYERLALTKNGVIKRSKEDAEGLQPTQFERYQILKENELVFKLIDLENVKTSRVGLSTYTGIVSPAYIVLNNRMTDNRFYYYYFMFMYYNKIFNNLGGEGVRSALNGKDLLKMPIILINEEKQKEIVDFLDKKTLQIDNLIENITKQIKKLQEYRKSIISEAVTGKAAI